MVKLKCRQCKEEISKLKFVTGKGFCPTCAKEIKEEREEKLKEKNEEKAFEYLDKIDYFMDLFRKSKDHSKEDMYLKKVTEYASEGLEISNGNLIHAIFLFEKSRAIYLLPESEGYKDSRAYDLITQAIKEFNPSEKNVDQIYIKLDMLSFKSSICEDLNYLEEKYKCDKEIEKLEEELKKQGKIITDKNGYQRGNNEHSDLIHRQNAYKYIYQPNRDKYPLPFSEYVVHHKDGNKQNNHSDNLELFTWEEHNNIHKKGHPHNPHKKKKHSTHKSRSGSRRR